MGEDLKSESKVWVEIAQGWERGRLPGHKKIRSSMKCFISRGWRTCVLRKKRKITDMNTLASFGEKADPIVVPRNCWK